MKRQSFGLKVEKWGKGAKGGLRGAVYTVYAGPLRSRLIRRAPPGVLSDNPLTLSRLFLPSQAQNRPPDFSAM